MEPAQIAIGALLTLIASYALVQRILSWIRVSRFKRQHGCKPAPRYPQMDPILGLDVFKTFKKSAVEHKALEAMTQRSLTMHRTMTVSLMGQSLIMTAEPENVKAVLALNFDDFGIGKRMSALGRLLGRGIFTADGSHWKHSRALIRPSFTRAQVADLDSVETHVQNLIKRFPEEDGTTFDIQPLFFNFTIDNSTEFLLGRSINCQTDPAQSPFTEAWDYAEACLPDRVRLGKLVFLWRNRKFDDACDLVHRHVDSYIAERTQGATDDKKTNRYNLLSELSEACSDPVLVRNELLNVLLAARDTTAGMLSSVFYFLARHPDVWRELAAEVAQLDGRIPDHDALKNMRFLRSVLDETLRLHPPVPVNIRFATRDTTLPLGGGADGRSPIFVAKGTAINYAVWAIHRLPEVYGADAEVFRPARWLDPARPLRPGWAYLPFNGGPRICLGQQSALVEGGYVVVRLMQHFARIEATGGEFREHLSLTLSHFDGVKIALWRKGE
ncbi:putative cytochrome P450 alkane hydroxylase [Lasiosphaeris hirsuta]|uniref:Cytochrome P450 alkane hydroxylase n=1 Tax=Lasiosphaeris hirsuta TaxID=260670 RepID=A0AA40DTV2_9PEZI|nr:putative cytochrome P450 alkane hydroxylase [Lasiosphaeris hirsuta]